jgi:hypothetical protein
MATAAARSDWHTRPLPAARAPIPLDRVYLKTEFDCIAVGFIPRDMDDRWFLFYEPPCLHIHRSWTGFCIFQVRFEPVAQGFRMVEALVNRDPDQYRETNTRRDALLVAALVDRQAGRESRELWDRYFSAPQTPGSP